MKNKILSKAKETNFLNIEFENKIKEGLAKNDQPLINPRIAHYNHSIRHLFNFISETPTTKEKQPQATQTPQEQAQQHKLNINYLCSLFNMRIY